jgi:hypothetical protein
VEEEVAADEVDEVVHKGPDKKGRVLWVVSHKDFKLIFYYVYYSFGLINSV